MPKVVTAYSVFIASPGDTTDLREITKKVIYQWNAIHGPYSSARVDPVLWEDNTIPELGAHPQVIVNQQTVDWCDMCVAIFRNKVGTPTQQAQSGTLEEIDRFLKAGKPVMLYFSDEPVSRSQLDAEEIRRLEAVKKDFQQKGLYGSFESPDSFRQKFTSDFAGRMSAAIFKGTSSNMESSAQSATSDESGEITDITLADEFVPIVYSFKQAWNAERKMKNFNGAKIVADDLLHDIKNFMRLAIASPTIDENGNVMKLLDTVYNDLAKLRDHRLYMDGGESTREFWSIGEGIVTNLDVIKSELGDEGSAFPAGG